MLRKHKFLSLFIFLVIVTIWYGFYFKKVYIVAEAPQKVRLALALQPGSGLAMLAIKKGFFTAEGLDVEVLAYPSGKRALTEGLFSGKADVATAADIPIAVAAFHNNDYKIIANIHISDNTNSIVANKKSGIQIPSDLKGKHIATQRASAVHFFLHLFLLEHEIDDSDVNISFMKAEELPLALEQGKVDAISMREPIVSQAKKLLKNNIVEFTAPSVYMQFESFISSAEFLRQKPQIIQKFLKAFLKAQTFVEEHPDESLELVAEYLGTSKERLGMSASQYYVTLEQSSILLLEEESRWIRHELTTGTDVMPNFLDFVDCHPLEQLKPDVVTIIR